MEKYKYTTNIIWKSSLLVLVYIKSNQNIYNFKICIFIQNESFGEDIYTTIIHEGNPNCFMEYLLKLKINDNKKF